MKYLILSAGILSIFFLSSCSLFLKSTINKKFPPINTIDKKIQSVNYSNEVLSSIKEFDADIEISNSLVDTASNIELKKSNGDFVLSNNILDSLKINHFRTEFNPQEVTIESSQIIYLAATTNKWIRGVDFYVSASLSPYYSNDTIYFNPYFNRIHVHKIYFKKCAFLTKLRPLTALLNSIFNSYLDNINGQVKNYFVVVSYPQDKQISLSSIFQKQANVEIEKDGIIQWHKKNFSSSILVRDKEINFLLGESKKSYSDSVKRNGGLSVIAKEKLFKKLFNSYSKSFDSVKYSYFDASKIDSNYLAKINITTNFLQSTLNDGLNNIDFRFKYPIGYSVNGIEQEVNLRKPNPDCGCDGIVDNIFHCSGGLRGIPCRIAKAAAKGACYAGSFTIPGISTYMTFCLAMKTLPADFQWTIGEVKGNAQADCSVHTVLNGITFSKNLTQVTIAKQLSVDGRINYDFNFSAFNKFNIGSTVFAILTQCPYFELVGHPSVQGDIPNDFVIDIAKIQDENKSSLGITIKPFQANVDLSQSPGMAIVTDFKNYFTCNIGYSAIGIAFVMAHIIPDNVIPDKFRDYYDVFTKGKLDHTFEIKTFKIPLDFNTKSIIGQITSDVNWGTKSINSTCFFKAR